MKMSHTISALALTLVISLPSFGQVTPHEPNITQSARKPLLTAKELQLLVGKEGVRIINVGLERREFNAGHIPGAQFVHWIDDITDPKQAERFNIVKKDSMQKLLRGLGLHPKDHVVLYDNLSSRLSTRLYWSLKVYGHKNVSVLDGGQNAWRLAGGTWTNVIPNVEPSQYIISQDRMPTLSANRGFIRRHLNDENVRLIDGRPPKQYTGEEPGRVFHTGTAHKHRGHIPGATHVFWMDNFNPNGTFKSAQQLKTLYTERGIKPQQTAVSYCNEGLHAAPPWFVLSEILGFEDVRVYDDSMSEWANSDEPMQLGPSPSADRAPLPPVGNSPGR